MINYLTAAQWSDNLWIVAGLVVVGTAIAMGLLSWLFKDYSDSV